MSALDPATRQWLTGLGFSVGDDGPWVDALTHGSFNGAGAEVADYQRLEFLGDRVLGLSVASWLYRAGTGSEGKLSQRLNALVSGVTCARIARQIGLPDHIRLGRQARDDGGADSDKILGDVMEALIGALYLDHGIDAARDFVRRVWADRIETQTRAPKHPKSALQEWAAAHNRRPPEYAIVERFGPHHAPRFRVRVTIGKLAEVEAEGASKQEAETAAAKAMLEKLQSA